MVQHWCSQTNCRYFQWWHGVFRPKCIHLQCPAGSCVMARSGVYSKIFIFYFLVYKLAAPLWDNMGQHSLLHLSEFWTPITLSPILQFCTNHCI